jgi:hypothetical protein
MASPNPARQPAKLTMPSGAGHLRRERLFRGLDEARDWCGSRGRPAREKPAW